MTPPRRYLLDTNIISDAQKPRPNPLLAAWLEEQADGDLFLAALTVGEIWQGILAKEDGRRKRALLAWFKGPSGPGTLFAGRILPFDEAAALRWAELMAAGRREGRPRSALDMQVAAVAAVNGCVVVTCNTRHFEPVRDEVGLLDPTSPGS